jgi:hypothetical protein
MMMMYIVPVMHQDLGHAKSLAYLFHVLIVERVIVSKFQITAVKQFLCTPV